MTISDNVTTNGRFYAVYPGVEALKAEGKDVTYNWYKSTNGVPFVKVERKRVESSHYNVAYDGAWVDIVLDGGVLSDNPTNTITNVAYKVELVVDGNKMAESQPVVQEPLQDPEIPLIPLSSDVPPVRPDYDHAKAYYNSLQNGSFEVPFIRPYRTHWTTGHDRYALYDRNHPTNADNFVKMEGYCINRSDLTHDVITNWLWQANSQFPATNMFYYYRPSVIWKTTAPDGAIEIANGDGNPSDYWSVPAYSNHYLQASISYNFADAAAGVQFAELNCNYPSQLYQDIITIPGSTIHWSVSHRARKSPGVEYKDEPMDMMYVMIGSTHKIIEDDITTTNKIKYVSEHPEEYPGFSNTVCVTGNDHWKTYEGSYLVPAGQYYTRMAFVSIETATGAAGGNFLDDVTFALETPAPVGDLDDAVERLWITDHEDAGDGSVYLEFEPIFYDKELRVEDWMKDFVMSEGIYGVIRIACGTNETQLAANIANHRTASAQLRGGDGNHNHAWDRQRVWITVPLPPEDQSNSDTLLWKIIIDHPRDEEQ